MAVKNGCWEAKKDLDFIYDKTKEFKEQNPDYKKWDKDYSEYLNQDIILL